MKQRQEMTSSSSSRRWLPNADRRFALAIASTGTVFAVVCAPRYWHPSVTQSGDRWEYWQLATGDPTLVEPPFRWRILKPFIAGMLPGDTDRWLQTITIVSLLACGYLVYSLAYTYTQRSAWCSLLTVSFYMPFWTARYSAGMYWLVDSTAWVFLLLSIVSARQRRAPLFVLALTLGVLSKEAVLAAAPLWWTLRPSRRSLYEAVALTTPAVVAYGLVRLNWPGTHSLGDVFRDYGSDRLRDPAFWPSTIVPALWPMVLPVVFGLRCAVRAVVPLGPLVIAVLAQFLIATDTYRLAVWLFPVAVAASAAALERGQPMRPADDAGIGDERRLLSSTTT